MDKIKRIYFVSRNISGKVSNTMTSYSLRETFLFTSPRTPLKLHLLNHYKKVNIGVVGVIPSYQEGFNGQKVWACYRVVSGDNSYTDHV